MSQKPSINDVSYQLDRSFRNAGLYTKEEIRDAKFRKYSRFGRVLDPYGRLNNTKEYLFFTKPDLHLVDRTTGLFNNQLTGNGYLQDLVRLYPDVVRELQSSAPALYGEPHDPFSHLLSFGVNSSLDMPSIEASTIDTPATMFGTSIEYLGNAEASDENPTFSLEFIDTKELELYHFFKAYQEYHIERKSGRVTPPLGKYGSDYTLKKTLHNVMGVYKFLVDEDMETLIYWAYFWGVFPTSAPREAFSEPTFPDGLTFSINFKAQFVDDMDPLILKEFNSKMISLCKGKTPISVNDMIKIENVAHMPTVNGTLPSAAMIFESGTRAGSILPTADPFNSGTRAGRPKYKIRWF